MATAKRLKIRCFLEGQEVPIIAINVQVAPNSPMVATIQLPPLSEGTKIKPRTLVHVYFLDYWAEAPAHVYKRGESIDKTDRGPGSTYDYSLARYNDSLYEADDVQNIEADIKNRRYKLLFGGEVTGFQWAKTPTQRSLVLQCQDWSNYWDYAMQFKNTDLFGPGYKAMFSGGGTSLFTDFLTGPGEVIAAIIMQKSVQYPRLEGLLGGIVHLLEAIGGAYYTNGGKTFSGQNIFFSVAELRLKITQTITAYENDPSAKKLLGGQYDGLFGRTLGNLGDEVSFRKAINALTAVIFHESYAQPCPLYQPGFKGSIDGYERVAIADDPPYANIAEGAKSLVAVIQTLKESLLGPGNTSTEIDLENEPPPDLAEKKDEFLLSIKNTKKACTDLADRAKKAKLDKAVRYINEAKTSIGRVESKVNVKWKKPASSALNRELAKKLDEAMKSLKIVQELSTVKNKKKDALPARLNQQIFRPDVWFTAPPRCNVIFPEQYTSLEYQRDFLAEPTRLLLKTNDEFFGEDELFDCFYFAPKLSGLKSKKNELMNMLAGDIMQHEIYTGILPIFEKMGEFNIFGVRAGTSPTGAKGKAKSGSGGAAKKGTGKKVKVGLAQRSCNFLFFRYRFGARQMRVVGTFNPYVACGFPGFVIDKYVDLEHLRKMSGMMVTAGFKYRPITDLTGTHFLGSFNQVTHTAEQGSGGSTVITMQYPREYNERVEFLGASNEDTQQVSKRMEDTADRETDLAAIDPPPLYALGPNFGVIQKVENITKTYTSTSGNDQKKLPFYSGPRRSGTGELSMKVPIGVTRLASEFGPPVLQALGGVDREVTFKAYRVTEKIPRYRTEKILVPAEELIRPGWYGDCWHPSLIGQVYEQFFRIGAITDPQQVADPAGASTGVPNQDAEDALRRATNQAEAQTININEDENINITAPSLFSLESESSIQQACTFLLYVYAYIRTNELDVEDFIRSYTWRPIATMIDMFGSADLELDAEGDKVVKGIEGLHSRAFGPYEDLFALAPPEVQEILNVKRGSSLAKKADTRKAKWDAVRDIVDALTASRALLG